MLVLLIVVYAVMVALTLYEIDKICYRFEQEAIGARRQYRRFSKARDRRVS